MATVTCGHFYSVKGMNNASPDYAFIDFPVQQGQHMMDLYTSLIVQPFLFQHRIDHILFFGIILKVVIGLFKGAETALAQGQHRQVMGLGNGQIAYGQ